MSSNNMLKIDRVDREAEKKAELNSRIKQIRTTMFGENNRKFAQAIGENEQTLSQICIGNRNAGQAIISKILEALPDISADWLIAGRGDMFVEPSSNHRRTYIEPTQTANEAQIALLRELLREKDSKIEELIADNAQLRQQLRNLLYKEDATTIQKSEQPISTETELSTI